MVSLTLDYVALTALHSTAFVVHLTCFIYGVHFMNVVDVPSTHLQINEYSYDKGVGYWRINSIAQEDWPSPSAMQLAQMWLAPAKASP